MGGAVAQLGGGRVVGRDVVMELAVVEKGGIEFRGRGYIILLT